MQRPNPEAVTLSDILSTEGLSYALISNLPSGAVFVVDRELRYLLAEGEALATAGFKPEDFVGRTISEALPPELAASYEPMYRQALAGESFEHEHDAHEHTYISRGTPLQAEAGEVYAVLVVSYDITERKQSEAALHESEARFRTLANTAPALIWYNDAQGNNLFLNQYFLDFTGKSAQEIRGEGWHELIHPDDAEAYIADYLAAVREQLPWHNRNRIRRHDGVWRWHDNYAQPLFSADGVYLGHVGVTIDNTEAIVAEIALRESEQRYRHLVELTPHLVWNADEQGCNIYTSPQMGVYVGLPTEQLLNLGWETEIHPEDVDRVHRNWMEAVQTGISYEAEYRLRKADWEYRWHLVRAVFEGNEQGRKWFGVSTDIHDRKQAEATLRESEARLQSIANLVPDLLWDSEPDGSTNWYNQRWMEYTGQTFETAIGWGWIDAIHPDDREGSARRYREAVEQGMPLQQEHRLRRHDGAYRWFVVKASPLKDERGKVIKMYGAATDIHEQRVALEALRESETKYRTLFNAMEEGFCSIEVVYDEGGQPVDHRILEANPAFERHTGLTAVQGRLASELMPGVEQFWNDLYARVVATGESERLEQYSSAFDRWFNVEISRIEDESLHRVAVVFQDISDRKRAEAALRESEEKYRSLFDSVDEGYLLSEVIFDENDQPVDILYLEANPAAVRLAGRDFSGRRMREIDPNYEDYWYELIGRVALTGESVRAEHYAEPHGRWFDFYAFKVGGQESRRAASIFQDTTDRKNRELNVAFLDEIGKELPRLSAPDEIMQTVGARAGEFLGLSGCYFVDVDEAKNEVTVHYGWGSEKLPSLMQTFKLEDYLTEDFIHMMRAGEVFLMRDTAQDERAEAENYARLKVASFVTVPFLRSGRYTGHIAVTSEKPRDWQPQEIELLQEIASRIFPRIERARAEEALRESEAKYRSLFDSIDTGFCIFEMLYNEAGEAIDFRYIETNPAFERQSGRRPQPGQTMREIFPEAEDMWLKDYAEAARTGQAKRFIDYHEDLDRWFDVFVFPTSNGKNQLAALFSDVTEEKRSEAALRESEARLQKALSIETVGVLFFTLDGRITDANDTFLRLSGYSRDELRNIAHWQELTPPEFWDATSVAAEDLATLGNTAPYEKQHIRKDGSRWWGLFSPTRLKGSGRSAECVEFVIDISDRKQAEAQLLRAVEMDAFRVKLADALRSLADPIEIQRAAMRVLGEHLQVDRVMYAEVDDDGETYSIAANYVRGAYSTLVGRFPTSNFGTVSERLRAGETFVVENMTADERLSEAARAAFIALDVYASVGVPLIKAGRWVANLGIQHGQARQWTEEDIELVQETAERTWAAVERAYAEAALRESELQRVREQSAREQESQRAEALAELDRAKTAFFSNVSHEFRTPLTLSLAPLQDALSDRTHPLDPVHRERLELVHRNSLRLLKLVNTLLDFSRIEAGRMEAVYAPTDLATYTTELASVFRSAIERAGLQLIVDCPPLPEPVFVDREMWEKIVLNLLSNAFKFTFEGAIRVSLHSTDSNQVVLQIQDTGEGIAPEHLPHLFERFYQVRGIQARTHEGSGIGLALVNELVRLQGGTIEVSSTLGEGTCFTIALPFGTDHLPSDRLHFEGDRFPIRTLSSTAMGAPAYVEEAERWATTQGNQEQTIDNVKEQTTQSADSSLPTLTSARVLVVDDNADMREYLTRILSQHVQVEAVADGATALTVSQEQVPDLILSDVMMPGLDGFELLEALRADPRTREVPIILLSARAGEEAIVVGLQAGADDYLIKPFSAQELISRVTAHLQMAQLRGEALQEARSTIRSRDEFISVVSHELNTPLVSILGWTRLLRANSPNPTMLAKALDTIERNATLQAKLVQDLLDISRIEAGKLRLNAEPVELEAVIETAMATVTQMAQAKGIDLNWHKNITARDANSANSIAIVGDRDRLEQVICNLLSNAIKFTPSSGSVTIELSVIDDDHFPNTSCARICVTDTGIGIAADFLPHVFERFRQARDSDAAKGLGLGLAIARHIVELHNGTISAQSAGVGQGATFTVKLGVLVAIVQKLTLRLNSLLGKGYKHQYFKV